MPKSIKCSNRFTAVEAERETNTPKHCIFHFHVVCNLLDNWKAFSRLRAPENYIRKIVLHSTNAQLEGFEERRKRRSSGARYRSNSDIATGNTMFPTLEQTWGGKEEEDCHAAGNLAPRSANWDRSDRPNRRNPAFLFSSMDASSWIIIRNNSESYMTAAREAGRHVVITKTEMTVWLFRRLIRNCEKVIAVRAPAKLRYRCRTLCCRMYAKWFSMIERNFCESIDCYTSRSACNICFFVWVEDLSRSNPSRMITVVSTRLEFIDWLIIRQEIWSWWNNCKTVTAIERDYCVTFVKKKMVASVW